MAIISILKLQTVVYMPWVLTCWILFVQVIWYPLKKINQVKPKMYIQNHQMRKGCRNLIHLKHQGRWKERKLVVVQWFSTWQQRRKQHPFHNHKPCDSYPKPVLFQPHPVSQWRPVYVALFPVASMSENKKLCSSKWTTESTDIKNKRRGKEEQTKYQAFTIWREVQVE